MANYRFTRSQNYAHIAGRRLRLAREAAKLRQEDIGEPLGLKWTTVSGYETGRREMAVEVAVGFAKQLKSHPAYLLGIVDELDRDLLELPTETKMHVMSAFKSAGGKK